MTIIRIRINPKNGFTSLRIAITFMFSVKLSFFIKKDCLHITRGNKCEVNALLCLMNEYFVLHCVEKKTLHYYQVYMYKFQWISIMEIDTTVT